jgi:hypothetical protein
MSLGFFNPSLRDICRSRADQPTLASALRILQWRVMASGGAGTCAGELDAVAVRRESSDAELAVGRSVTPAGASLSRLSNPSGVIGSLLGTGE